MENKKLVFAKKMLAEYQQKVGWWRNSAIEAEDNYKGNVLKENIERYNRWIEEDGVMAEALQDYVDLIESQIKQGEEHDADEAKVAELRNEANAMCEHND